MTFSLLALCYFSSIIQRTLFKIGTAKIGNNFLSLQTFLTFFFLIFCLVSTHSQTVKELLFFKSGCKDRDIFLTSKNILLYFNNNAPFIETKPSIQMSLYILLYTSTVFRENLASLLCLKNANLASC